MWNFSFPVKWLERSYVVVQLSRRFASSVEAIISCDTSRNLSILLHEICETNAFPNVMVLQIAFVTLCSVLLAVLQSWQQNWNNVVEGVFNNISPKHRYICIRVIATLFSTLVFFSLISSKWSCLSFLFF